MIAQLVNPWAELPNKPPYVLPQDRELIERFNAHANDRYRVRLEILPEPYLGNPAAPVVLLGLNPGFKPVDIGYHGDARFARLSRANLMHTFAEYPFYLLAPTICRTKYWERKLRCLIAEVGCMMVANKLLCVEFFPYHSQRFHHEKLCIPSQQYNIALARRAIARGAVILILRGSRLWFNSIPELENYPRKYAPSSVQNPVVSPRNFNTGFEEVVRVIREA